MPRFLIRIRPNGEEELVEGKSSVEVMRRVYRFLDLENFWSDTSSADLSREVLHRLHDCLVLFTSADEAAEADGPGNCPMAFDSWTCWNRSSPGTLQVAACPQLEQFGYDGTQVATRLCQKDGIWWRHPESNKTWSNYTQCPNFEQQQFRDAVMRFTLVGLVTSLVALGLSLAVFCAFRSLRCGRIAMHKHLFSSLAVSNLMWLIWHFAVLDDPSVWPHNPVWCRVLNSVMTYFTISTYLWMFCEGVYLQTLLSLSLTTPDRTIRRALAVLGWVGPVTIVAPYVCFRASRHSENVNCWMDVGASQWLLTIPVAVLLISNTIILIYVIMVLRNKLKLSPSGINLSRSNSAPVVTMKSVRAAFLLIPILGVHFLLLPVRPEVGSAHEYAYDILSALLSAYQGLTVSLLFCFLNGQVLAAFRKQWHRWQQGEGNNVASKCQLGPGLAEDSGTED